MVAKRLSSVDPSGTYRFRAKFLDLLAGRLNVLKNQIWRVVHVEDGFGLVLNYRRFTHDEHGIEAFESFVREFALIGRDKLRDIVQDVYADATRRAYKDARLDGGPRIGQSAKEHAATVQAASQTFVRETFYNPQYVARVRTTEKKLQDKVVVIFDNMVNKLVEMAWTAVNSKISPYTAANWLVQEIRPTFRQFRSLVETEVVRVHAEALLDAYERLGETHVGLVQERRTPRESRRFVTNAFCPTGEGGGQDNSCPPRREWPPKSKESETEKFNRAAKHVFGDVSSETIRDRLFKVLGIDALPGAVVKAYGSASGPHDSPGILVHVSHPKVKIMERFIGNDERGLFIENKVLKLHETGTGLGADIFSSQALAASRLGFREIRTLAAGGVGGGEGNGYYTWPRLGYDMDIGAHWDSVRRAFPRAKSVLDIFQTKAGREWWKTNGIPLYDARFDLRSGSRSMEILNAYLQERRTRPRTNELRAAIITADDEKVCPICDRASRRGSYSIRYARGLIPFHKHCRCTWALVRDRRYEERRRARLRRQFS